MMRMALPDRKGSWTDRSSYPPNEPPWRCASGFSLLDGSADDHRDIVRAAGIERILQQVIADLLRARHGHQPLVDPFVRNMLGQAVAAQQMNVTPAIFDTRDHRRRLR